MGLGRVGSGLLGTGRVIDVSSREEAAPGSHVSISPSPLGTAHVERAQRAPAAPRPTPSMPRLTFQSAAGLFQLLYPVLSKRSEV